MNYPQTIAPGVVVIGRYEPSEFEPAKIGAELTELSKYVGLEIKGYGTWAGGEWQDHKMSSEIRSAEISNMILSNPGQYTTGWHQDSGNSDDGTLAMVLWSNREQTEIKLSDGSVIYPNPGDVLLIHNRSVYHRTPPKISEDRWFFRRYIQVPSWMEIAK